MVVEAPEVLDGLEGQDRGLVQLPGPGSIVAIVPKRPRVAERVFAHGVQGRRFLVQTTGTGSGTTGSGGGDQGTHLQANNKTTNTKKTREILR